MNTVDSEGQLGLKAGKTLPAGAELKLAWRRSVLPWQTGARNGSSNT